MATTLILIRHGNTFDAGDIILRVGCHTDLPLSSSGRAQAEKIGPHLRALSFIPSAVFVSPLMRTQETARIALATLGIALPLTIHPALNEIDYGPDEGRPETEVVARNSEAALKRWEEETVMPEGWSPTPDDLRSRAGAFRTDMAAQDGVIWAVTSNGVARFVAESCRWDVERPSSLRLSTAAYAVLSHENGTWTVRAWNQKVS